MTTHRALPCVLVAAALCLAAPGPAQTRLPEGTLLYWDCDRWESGGWRDEAWHKGGSGRAHFDPEVKQHGRAALRLDGKAGEAVAALSLSGPAQVETDQEYVLQIWTKTSGVAGVAEIRVLAHAPKAGEQYGPLGWVRLSDKTHFHLPADQDWTRQRIPLRKLPGGATRLFFYLRLEGEGTAWFDEFSVAQAGVEVPLGAQVALRDEDYAGVRFDDADLPENLLTNGGFEDGMSGWQMLPRDYSAGVDETVAHTGGKCFRFDATEFTSCHLYQTVDLDPRRYYVISLWARCHDLVGYFFTHLLPRNRHNVPTGWHGANHASEHHYVTGSTNGWEERRLVTKFRPDAAGVTIYARVGDTIGTVYVDDIVIRPLPLDYKPEEGE